jgi:putative NADPH-quinone reductase
MTTKVLIILGHPEKDSFSSALADAYEEGAGGADAEVRRLNLGELNFDPILRRDYDKDQPLEPDLRKAQEDIQWADHIVFVYPTWWGIPPALLHGFIERSFLPGFAFEFKEDGSGVIELLAGRSAHLIVTMNTSPLAYKLLRGAPGHAMMKRSVLDVCGVEPVRISEFGSLRDAGESLRKRWLNETRKMGRELK